MLELATAADRSAVNELALQSHMLHVQWRPDIYNAVEEYFTEAEFTQLIRERKLYVAKLDTTVVGFTLLSQHLFEGSGIVPRKVMSVDEFVVHETCRGHGIGKAMMEDIHALAKAYGCTDLQLRVYPQNDAAVEFYQKCGFEIQNIGMQKKV